MAFDTNIRKRRFFLLLCLAVCALTGCEMVGGEPAPTPLSVMGEAIVRTSVPREDFTAEPEPTASPEPEPEVITVTISAAGDCSLGNYEGQDYAYSFNQTYEQEQELSYFLRNVREIFSRDDLTIVNLEGVLTTSEEPAAGRTYNIKGLPSYVDILTLGSVEAVSMGNNHRQDYGTVGTADTVAALSGAGIVYAYDENVGMYETNGILIGYVSVNEVSWGAGCEELIQDGFERLREEGADLLIACCHWGIEGDTYPESYQQTLGRKCIDWGADLVIGHHPHVLQGIEEYNGRFIIYSLGNFCFGANRNPKDKDSMIFQQTFTFVDGEKQEDQNILVIPCSISSVSDRNNFQPTPLAGDEAARVIEKINGYSVDFGVTLAEDGTLAQ